MGVFVSSRVGLRSRRAKYSTGALSTLGVENREKVLMIGDSLKADIAGAQNAGLAACWCDYAGRGLPEGAKATHVIRNLEELYRIVMEPEELEHVGSKEKRHQV